MPFSAWERRRLIQCAMANRYLGSRRRIRAAFLARDNNTHGRGSRFGRALGNHLTGWFRRRFWCERLACRRDVQTVRRRQELGRPGLVADSREICSVAVRSSTQGGALSTSGRRDFSTAVSGGARCSEHWSSDAAGPHDERGPSHGPDPRGCSTKARDHRGSCCQRHG